MCKLTSLRKTICTTFLVIAAVIFALKTIAQSNQAFTPEQCINAKKISVHCGKTPTGTIEHNGRFWVVFEYHNHLYVSFSNDFGASFSPSSVVNEQPEAIYTNGENRPKIQLGLKGEIYISWTKKTAGRFTGDIRFSRSLDSGKSFSSPITINDDGLITGHRFDSMVVARDGKIFLSWIDKRDNQRQNKNTRNIKKNTKNIETKRMKQNGAIYTSFSENSGISFSNNNKLADSSCVCCRIAMTSTADNAVAISWRHVFPGSIRDHAYAVIDAKGVKQPPARVSKDDWKIEACPHHGPALTEDKNRQLHLVWFTASETRKGIYYGRLNAQSGEAENLVNLSNLPSASHPYIINNGKILAAVWKEFDGEKTQIKQVVSVDFGESWSVPLVIAKTGGESDHPFLHANHVETWLSWSTELEGLRLINLKLGTLVI